MAAAVIWMMLRANQVTQFTKLVDVSVKCTANAATDGITSIAADSTGKIITIVFSMRIRMQQILRFPALLLLLEITLLMVQLI